MKKAPAPVNAKKLKQLRTAVTESPDSPEAHLRLGTALLKSRNDPKSGGGDPSSGRVETEFSGGVEQSRRRFLVPLGFRRLYRRQS